MAFNCSVFYHPDFISQKGCDEASDQLCAKLAAFQELVKRLVPVIRNSQWECADEIFGNILDLLSDAQGILGIYCHIIAMKAVLEDASEPAVAKTLADAWASMEEALHEMESLAGAAGAFRSIPSQDRALDVLLGARDSVFSAGKGALEEYVSLRWRMDAAGAENYEEDDQNMDLEHIALVERLRSRLWEKAPKPSERENPGSSDQSLVDPASIDISRWTDKEEKARIGRSTYGKGKNAIQLRKDEFRILSEFARSTTESSSIALRAGIVVLCAAGASDKRSAKLLGITFKTVSKWRRIYAGSQEMIHSQKIWTLRDSIRKALSDDPRSGAPRKISIEAFSMLNKIACESPQSYGYPFSRWSGWSLAEAVRRLTGESMSESSALRGLSAFGLDPSKHELWLRSGSSAEEFALAAVPVLETYKNLDKLIAEGFMIYSTDEKMGIQAIERKMLREAAPAAERGGKGRLASYDPVYVRHGTTGIIASMNLGDGSVIAAIQNKREEIDYATHIRDTFALNPEKRHIFIEDNLNTHQSASLVWLVAMHEAGEDILQIDLEAWRPKEKNEDAGPRLSEQEAAKYAWLGAKGRSGPLKSMESRAGYLGDRTHQICFIHTPKHTSWMNRVECWFSIVSKHLLNYRLSVKSAEELNALIAEYIDFYNKKLRKCHNWKCVEHLLAKFGPIAQKAAKKAA